MRLLILIDSHTIALHESNLGSEALVQAVHTSNPCLHLPYRREGWQAVQLSDLVVALPAAGSGNLRLPDLSPRQEQVLAGLLQGLNTSQIAIRLNLSRGAVCKHIREMMRRLGASTREEALRKALGSVPQSPCNDD